MNRQMICRIEKFAKTKRKFAPSMSDQISKYSLLFGTNEKAMPKRKKKPITTQKRKKMQQRVFSHLTNWLIDLNLTHQLELGMTLSDLKLMHNLGEKMQM
jgi:hypothetical protein